MMIVQSFRRIEAGKCSLSFCHDGRIVDEIPFLPSRLLNPWRVAVLLAVALYLRCWRPIVLLLDVGQHFTQPLVLGDRRMRDALILVKDPIVERMPLPTQA